MVLENKFGKMLYKLGKNYTFKTATATTASDTFYGDAPATYTETTVRAVILPTRAYDIHSNVVYISRPIGLEEIGIISIFIEQDDCVIDVDDFVNVGDYWYKIHAKEIYDESYYIFEAKLGDEPS